jgi:serine/threonine protein kinase
MNKVSEGAYGELFLGTYLETEVAIKQFRKRKGQIDLENFLKEVEILNTLRHPNILLYMGVCIHHNSYYMITEFMKEGSLFDHLHKKQTHLSLLKKFEILEDIVLGMYNLHGREMLHCDLKSSNILVDDNWKIKLADFGLSRIKSTFSKIHLSICEY